MVKYIKSNKLLLALIAVAIIGFASYGSYNVIHAFNNVEQTKSMNDTTVSISTPVCTYINDDGDFCSPSGCAGCSGCTNPQYQQVVTDTGAPAEESGLSYE